MLELLKKNLVKYRLVAAGDLVIVGVSGGRDSMALLAGLDELAPLLGCSVLAAHFNHGIRGAAADLDEAFVRDFCALQGIEFVSVREDIPQLAVGRNLEEVGRERRYAWLNSLRNERLSAYCHVRLATAHQLEDQAETVLLHLLRGCGTEGLGAMAWCEGSLIRPLLNVPRAELEAYLKSRGLGWREDASNAEPIYRRNRLRLELLPQLAEYNPNLAAALGNTADICGVENDYLAQIMLRELDRLVTVTASGYILSCSELEALHPAIARRLVRELWRRAVVGLRPTAGLPANLALTHRHTCDILSLEAGKQISLPHEVYAKHQKGKLYIGKLPRNEEEAQAIEPFVLKKNAKNK